MNGDDLSKLEAVVKDPSSPFAMAKVWSAMGQAAVQQHGTLHTLRFLRIESAVEWVNKSLPAQGLLAGPPFFDGRVLSPVVVLFWLPKGTEIPDAT